MKCSICGEEVILVPSAQERARRFGGQPSDYTKLFPQHGICTVRKRTQETLDLIKRKTRL